MLQKSFQGRTPRSSGKSADVGRAEQVEELVRFSDDRLGGLDMLINNAGAGTFRPVGEMTPREWRSVMRTNLDSLFYSCHYALPILRRSGGGFIVNIGSLAGKNTFPGGAAYCASKFGLKAFSEALMQEVRYDDIRVAYVMPGSVEHRVCWKSSRSGVLEVVSSGRGGRGHRHSAAGSALFDQSNRNAPLQATEVTLRLPRRSVVSPAGFSESPGRPCAPPCGSRGPSSR